MDKHRCRVRYATLEIVRLFLEYLNMTIVLCRYFHIRRDSCIGFINRLEVAQWIDQLDCIYWACIYGMRKPAN